MIDRTSVTIEDMRAGIARDNARRYAFYTMLRTTDRILWRLEEMNRDGLRCLSSAQRRHIKQTLSGLPSDVGRAYRDSDQVQVVLDSIFDMQERLFKWRDPKWSLNADVDDLERLAV
ncbi:MAG: hypothetical protein WAM30_20415 [Candidatus Dormiibacterota bacterium]